MDDRSSAPRVLHVNLDTRAASVSGITSAIAAYQECAALEGIEAEAVAGGRDQLRAALAAVRSGRFDVVHLHSVFRPLHVPVVAACRRAGVPFVQSPHSGLATPGLSRQWVRKSAWIAAVERRQLAAAAAVVALTPTEAAEVAAASPRARTTVCPNPAPEFHSLERHPRPGRPLVVALARFDVYQKGLDHLAAIADHLPDVDFVVCGAPDGNSAAALERLEERLPENLVLSSPVRGAAKDELLATAHAYIAPSRWEGMSVAVLEALAAGVPTAVSAYVADSMELDDDAVLRLHHQPRLAAAELAGLLADPERCRVLSEAGPGLVEERYSAETVADTLAEVYRAATNPGPTR